jgi:hypothetical protein
MRGSIRAFVLTRGAPWTQTGAPVAEGDGDDLDLLRVSGNPNILKGIISL